MKDLTNERPFKVILAFAIPLIIAGLMNQTYNLIDLIVAGKFIGSDALSATGCTTTFIQFLSSLFWGIGVAISTICGELYGERKYDKIVSVIKTMMITITVLMLVLTVLCIVFANPLLNLLKVDEDIFSNAIAYFRVYMIALFIQALSYQITSVVQSLGNSKFPMIITTISGLGNLGLNLLFVIVFKLGVLGLAYATVISSLFALIINAYKIVKTIKELNGNLNFAYSKEELSKVMRIAIPCILQQCSLYLSSVAVQPFINNLGKEVSAGYSIAMNINLLINAIYHSLSRSVACYASQSKGAGKFKNLGMGIKVGLLQQIILMAPLVAVCLLIPESICHLFIKNNDTSCVPYAVQFIYICLPFIVFVAFGNLMHSFYKAVEATRSVLVSTFLFTVARIIFTYALPNAEYISSVYWGLSLAWIVEALILLLIYVLGKWKSKDQIEYENKMKSA